MGAYIFVQLFFVITGMTQTVIMSQNGTNINLEKFLVRQFKGDDRLAVQDIFSKGFKQYKDGPTSITSDYFVAEKLQEDMSDIQESYLNMDGGNFWVAEDMSLTSPKIVGIVGILPRNVTDEKSPVADDGNTKTDYKVFELQRMFVDQGYQGTGVAQLLIRHLEKFAFEKHNCRKVCLGTGFDMKQAWRFYEKQGYKKTHTESINIKDYYNGAPDFIYKNQYFEKSSLL